MLSLSYDAAHDEYQAHLLSQQGLEFISVMQVQQQSWGSIRQPSAQFDIGQILPLETLLKRYLASRPHHLLEAELEKGSTGWVYELEWIESGRVVKLHLDAQNGQILTHF